MTDDEIDAAIRALWPYLRPDAPTAAGMVYAREIFRAGMRAAATISDKYKQPCKCAVLIRKAAR